MKLEQAIIRLEPIVNKKFGDILTSEQLEGIIKNKGKSGQILEITLGLSNSSRTLDFEDGELKTNKCDRFGNPKETMFITQILSIIDDLLESKDFYETHIYKKISNLLYVPINKEGAPKEWNFSPYAHVDLNSKKFRELKKQLEEDYYSICEQLNEFVKKSKDGYIHTSNGKFIQVRSKDSKPYSPIYSKIYGRNVSNKNHAFYFKKEFMRYITSIK